MAQKFCFANDDDDDVSTVRLMATHVIHQIAQNAGLAGRSPKKYHEESKVQHCWFEVSQQLAETELNLLECPVSSGREKKSLSRQR